MLKSSKTLEKDIDRLKRQSGNQNRIKERLLAEITQTEKKLNGTFLSILAPFDTNFRWKRETTGKTVRIRIDKNAKRGGTDKAGA